MFYCSQCYTFYYRKNSSATYCPKCFSTNVNYIYADNFTFIYDSEAKPQQTIIEKDNVITEIYKYIFPFNPSEGRERLPEC